MKKRILLIDESLTVQKVVALTLDKNRYGIQYAKTRAEALRSWAEKAPDLVLVGDQVPDIAVSSFPKEIEVWLGREAHVPPMILITSKDLKEQKHYAAVLKKPFAPSTLQNLVLEFVKERQNLSAPSSVHEVTEDFEDERLQKIFNETFADESSLVRETFQEEAESNTPRPLLTDLTSSGFSPQSSTDHESEASVTNLWEPQREERSARPTPKNEDLWGMGGSPNQGNAFSQYEVKSSPSLPGESDLTVNLEEKKLDEIVDRILSRIVPPIVERLVQERLDKLLKAHEEFVEIKP